MRHTAFLTVIMLAFLGLNDIRAQETTVVPSMDLYDTGMMNMYLSAAREAAAIDNQMAERMQVNKAQNTTYYIVRQSDWYIKQEQRYVQQQQDENSSNNSLSPNSSKS